MDTLSELWDNFVDLIKNGLPRSPFSRFLADFEDVPFLGYLNWFVPVQGILIVLTAWLSAVTLFYLYSIIMRWLKVIGD